MTSDPHGTPANPYDLLITSGTVIDGTGRERMVADVAVKGERIVAIGDLYDHEAVERLDASGYVVAPGFIDAHTHDDRAVLSGPDMTPKVSQGVTTVVTGNCGVSLAPLAGREPVPPLNLLGDREWFRFGSFAEYVQALEESPPAVNLAMLAGHSSLRVSAMSELDRPATAAEIDRMQALLEEGLGAGCIGMSTGLAYPPAEASTTDEVVALAERLAAHGAIYTTHMRDERSRVVDSVRETLEVGRRAGVPVVISHHKCSGRENWGLSRETLAIIEAARREQTVDLDAYPYTASSTVLLAPWVGGAERVLVTWSRAHPELAGRDLETIRAGWGCSMEEACERLQPAGAIYYQMDEGDLQRIMAFEDTMIGSDGLPHDEFPHPRLWGTFPRVLGHYCRDLGLFSLEEAVRRMSGVPARVFGLADRGVLRPEAYADIVLFEPNTIIDRADFERPKTIAEGIPRVIVNGQTVWRGREPSGVRSGRLLRREAP